VPRVSVIVPAFNAERYLPEALASVARQTYRDWEVVVADDASTDRTVELAAGFGDRFNVLRALVNGGPAAARNSAIEASHGDLLAFLDADDFWHPDYLQYQVGLYDESGAARRRVGLVACDARILAADGYRSATYMDVVGFPGEVTLTRLLSSNSIYVSALSPRAIVNEVGGFCPALARGEDYDLWLRILEAGYRVVANRRPLAVYRLRETSLSSEVGAMARDLQLAYRRALERGQLTQRQRRIVRRQLRLNRALEEAVSISATRGDGGAHHGRRVLRSLPLRVLVQLENPDRWRDLTRRGLGRPSRLSALDRHGTSG
jgi:glycosyltransferase involved in cell wall biosynthesis